MYLGLDLHNARHVDDSDEALLERVQRATFRYFWEGAHPHSGLARDRSGRTADPNNDLISVGGSGFAFMAIIVAVERGWITRHDAIARMGAMLSTLERATRYQGVYPHFINGRDGSTVPFSRLDDGGDLVETSLLFQGLICVRQYLASVRSGDAGISARIDRLWRTVDWSGHVKPGTNVLYWHHSPKHGWARNVPIRGWNEALITYVLAAASPDFGIEPHIYHEGFAANGAFVNGRNYHGITLPLGPDYGGPLFFAHYSFCGLDPRGLKDRYADYWQQNCNHSRINYLHSTQKTHSGDCWGLTSSHAPKGYAVSSPASDTGLIAPTAALSSLPYTPDESMRALRHFMALPKGRIAGRFGFVDAFAPARNWYARTYLAINQGPIVAMIENHRSGLLWQLFMSAPEIGDGLRKLGFDRPHVGSTSGP